MEMESRVKMVKKELCYCFVDGNDDDGDDGSFSAE